MGERPQPLPRRVTISPPRLCTAPPGCDPDLWGCRHRRRCTPRRLVDKRPVLQCSWDAHYMADHADGGNVLTFSGLWYHMPGSEQSDLSAAAKRRAARVVVSSLAQPALTAAVVLALWASMPYPLCSPDRPPQQPPALTIRDPHGYYSLATAYLVRGLVSWRVCNAGQLHLSLLVEPHWHLGPLVRLIVSPQETLY